MFSHIKRILFLILATCLVAGCGGSSDDFAVQNQGAGGGNNNAAIQTAQVQINQVIQRALPAVNLGAVRVTGFGPNGELLFGPQTVRGAQPVINLTMNVRVSRVEVEYLDNANQTFGFFAHSVSLSPGTIERITDPDWIDATSPVNSFEVQPPAVTLTESQQLQLLAVATLDDGSTTDVSTQAAWEVLSETPQDGPGPNATATITIRDDGTVGVPREQTGGNVITVDQNGLVTVVANGTAVVRTTLFNGVYLADSRIRVRSSSEALSLNVTPEFLNVQIGSSVQFRAFLNFPDGDFSQITDQCTWTVSDTFLARVVEPGLIQGEAVTGQEPVIVTADCGPNLTGTAELFVNSGGPPGPNIPPDDMVPD